MIVRRFVTFLSAFIITSLFAGKLTDYTLAEDPELETEVLGVSTEDNVIEVLPTKPRILSIFKPKTVEIYHMGTIYRGVTYSRTVEEAIEDLGVEIIENSLITPDKDYILGLFTSVRIDEIERVKHVEYEYIAYDTIEQEDDTTEWGKESIVQPGITGQRKLTFEYLYINNVYKGKILVSEEIVVEPQEEIVAIGTKKVFKEITINGDTFSYWITMNVYATSYDSSCPGCSTRTATGMTLDKGIIAVDPTVIPLHTKMYVPGYGFGAAEDTGGAIKGYKIDLGFDDLKEHQGEWSARYVDIYLLD